jgi:hypothetical protein
MRFSLLSCAASRFDSRLNDATQGQDHPGERQDMSGDVDVQDVGGVQIVDEDVMDHVGDDAEAGERQSEAGD